MKIVTKATIKPPIKPGHINDIVKSGFVYPMLNVKAPETTNKNKLKAKLNQVLKNGRALMMK